MTSVQSKPKPKKRVAWGWILAFVLLVIGGWVYFQQSQKAQNQARQTASAKIQTATVTQANFRVSVTGPGMLAAHQSVDFKPQVQGTILLIPKVGDHVTRGQLIVRLDPTTYQRAADNAQLALDKAKAQLQSNRASSLSNIGGQQQGIASAQAAYSNAQTALLTAQQNLAAAQRIFAIGGNTRQELDNAHSSVEQAKANVDSAKVAFETARQSLPLKQSSNTQDLINLQLTVDQAALTLKNAQQDLANTKIFATFNGTVSAVNGQVGAVGVSASIAGSSALLTVIDSSSLDLPVQIDETEISQVKLGQKANVTLDAFPNQSFSGTVTAISPSATVIQNIAVFYVTVNVPNPQGLLKAGMTAEGEVIIKEITNALILPSKAVQIQAGRSWVQIPQPDGSAKLVPVQTGPNDGSNVVIMSGLKAGDKVMLASAPETSSSGPGLRIPGGGP